MPDRTRSRGFDRSRISLSSEWSLLVVLGRHATGLLEPDHHDSLVDAPVDWEALLDLADDHGLSPLLFRLLDAAPGLDVPPPVLARLRTRVRLRTRESLRLTGELLRLTTGLKEVGIESIAYKGPVLSERLYGAPALRDYDDLDLLIRARDVAGATDFLKSRGFEPWFDLTADQEGRLPDSQYARHFGHPVNRVPVDLHWGFAQPYLSSALDEASIWSQTEEVTLGGTAIRTLSDSLLLLVLCVHGSKHEPYPWNRLKWIVDVAALVQRIREDRWSPLLDQAQALRLDRPLLFGLLVAHRLLSTPLPRSVWHRLEDTHGIEELTDAAIDTLTSSDGDPPPLSRLQYDLRLLDRWRDRIRYLLHRGFVPNPKDWSAVDLPRGLAPLYYVVRPFRLWRQSLSRWRRTH